MYTNWLTQTAAFTIGSHTHSHRKLATLDNDAQRDELARSKQILQAKLRRPVKALAYPYGWPGTYTIANQGSGNRSRL